MLLQERLAPIREGSGLIVVVTGAGISAESGIPTFRGPEGYWTVGSSVYRPEELATAAAFSRMPEDVWAWYLHRREVCQGASPNAGHKLLHELETHYGDRFLLITQNVDGLHLRAGNSKDRCYEVHGNIDYMRCANACSAALTSVPEFDTSDPVACREQLRCPACGGAARPHVLWFDECYDETLYRFESSLRAAPRADLILTIGTTASTNLPVQVFERAVSAGALSIDINPNENPFGQSAELGLCGPASEELPALFAALTS